MTENQSPTLDKAAVLRHPTFLELILDAQRRNGWTDEELEHKLGLRKANLMALVREGVVQLSYDTALNIESHLEANVLQTLQASLRSHAASMEAAVLSMYALLKVDGESHRIIQAYGSVLDGDTRVSTLKLTKATVWIVPDATMKPEGENEGEDEDEGGD
ncbi:hypothetical protein B2J86_08120 [Acidovorax sp. SRB_14]|uniref:hypothetical protein n=1 Tax=Acidovorax sp. SRB_14 TaxID=1962699 RepID=UPI0015674CB8|nr:hypothetical protein [Acidovorax sp. SRB_14]NMM80891.1 hypothetical protein [Acidovorax sp. SRB_14]